MGIYLSQIGSEELWQLIDFESGEGAVIEFGERDEYVCYEILNSLDFVYNPTFH